MKKTWLPVSDSLWNDEEPPRPRDIRTVQKRPTMIYTLAVHLSLDE